LIKEKGLGCCAEPPREVVRKFFDNSSEELTDADIKNLAKNTLLSKSDVSFWIEHLKNIKLRRKRGAEKAAETRKRK
jgi:hypothetical protein